MSADARTRKDRPIAAQNPNLPGWVMVHDLGRSFEQGNARVPHFYFNLTPAAAEDLGNELIQVAATARAEQNQEDPPASTRADG